MSREQVRQAFAQALDLAAGVDVESLEIGNNAHWGGRGASATVRSKVAPVPGDPVGVE